MSAIPDSKAEAASLQRHLNLPRLHQQFRRDRTGLNKGLIDGSLFVYLPLTPRHLLITGISFSRDAVDAFMLSKESTELLQWGIVSNAHRYVYAASVDDRVEQWRPQLLNREMHDDLDAERKR